jgi:hypothetical protein
MVLKKRSNFPWQFRECWCCSDCRPAYLRSLDAAATAQKR